MHLSNEQMSVVRFGRGAAPTYEWVDVPVGPQPLPAWARGLKIHWMDGYANAPHYTVKTDRALQHWPDQVFTKEGERYLALSGDGRARCYYAHGEPFITDLEQKMVCYPVSPPDAPDVVRYDKTGRWFCSEMKPSGRIWWSTYRGWATQKDRGFGGWSFHIKLDDGRWLMLRGPWHGPTPAGYVDVGGTGGSKHPRASGAGTISEDVLILLIAKHYPECRVARVTQHGRTEVQAVRPDWDEPKLWMDERARLARKVA